MLGVKVGEVYEGVVSGVMPFGLFVTVSVPLAGETEAAGHIEGLVHISEMSWEKVNDPHELYKVGQHIQVKVLGVEEAAGKLNLSLKQLGTDPWVDIETRYPVGTTVTGTVSRVVQFGVFVKVEPGVDGLIHTSKLSPDQQFQPGDQVTVVVESVEPTQRRMSLSAVLTEVPMGYK
jgi:ribosomal protein S1